MIIERKNEKQIEQAVKEIKLFDFTTLTEGNWGKVFSLMKKHLTHENVRKPFLVEISVSNGKPLADMWFVSGSEKLEEHCLRFDLTECYVDKNKIFEKNDMLTEIWRDYLCFRFKCYREYLHLFKAERNV